MKLIGVAQAAERLGVTDGRVRVLITSGRLPAQKVGRDWVINESDLRLVAVRIPGNPNFRKNSRKARKKS